MPDDAAMPPLPRFWTDVPRGRVLVFAPHPDDEVAGPGGVLALHRRSNDPVRVVVATDGTTGDPDRRYDPNTYAELRRGESRAGLREVGVDDVSFWGFPDGHVLSPTDLALGERLATAEIERWRPDLVYLPWEREGHADHHNLHVVVTRALDRMQWRGLALGYEIWNAMVPDVVVDVTAVMQKKRAAMLAHKSQIAYVTYDHSLAGLNAYRSLVHQRGKGYGEAFRLVRGSWPAGGSAG
jgi:LmbE family N-acetylglucosaminyl deacetylase